MVKTESSIYTEIFANVKKSSVSKFKRNNKAKSTTVIQDEDVLELVESCTPLVSHVHYEDAVSETKTNNSTAIVQEVKIFNEEENSRCHCCSGQNHACGEVHVFVPKEVSTESLAPLDQSLGFNLLDKTFQFKLGTGQSRFALLTCDLSFLVEMKTCLEKFQKLLEDVNRKYSKESQDKCLVVLLFKDIDETTMVLVGPYGDVQSHLHSELGNDDSFQVIAFFLGNYKEKNIENDFNVRFKVAESTNDDRESQELAEIIPSGSGTNYRLSYCSERRTENVVDIESISTESDDEHLDHYHPDDKEEADFPKPCASDKSNGTEENQPREEEAMPLQAFFRKTSTSSGKVSLTERLFNPKVKITKKPENKIIVWFTFGISTAAAIVSVVAIIFVSVQKEHVSYQDENQANKNEIRDLLNDSEILLQQIKQIQAKITARKFNIKHVPVSAHRSLALPPRIPGSENKPDPYFKKDYNVCVRINTRYNPRDHARGVNVDLDGLVILYSGLYFVYSSVAFKPNSTAYSATFPYQTWFQYIYKVRPNSPAHSTVLTRVVHTCCLNCTNSQNTAFSGGVFYLLAGDKLQICLTGQGLIAYDDTTTYLGLFMISGAAKP